jgi:nitroreductase
MLDRTERLESNAVLKTIRARHSIRRFSGRDVPEELLNVVLDAANRAPSAHNRQSWKFLVVRGRKKEELARLCASRAADFPRPASVLLRMAARSVASAPAVVAVANTGDLIRHGRRQFQLSEDQTGDFFRIMEIQSSAAAVEILLLAATSLGLATVWLGILYLLKDDVLEILGEPGGEFMAVVPVGWAAVEGSGPAKRPLAAVVRHFD